MQRKGIGARYDIAIAKIPYIRTGMAGNSVQGNGTAFTNIQGTALHNGLRLYNGHRIDISTLYSIRRVYMQRDNVFTGFFINMGGRIYIGDGSAIAKIPLYTGIIPGSI